MLIVAASQHYGGQAYSLRSKEDKRLLAGCSTVTPGTVAIKAIGMTSLPDNGNCRSCEHKNIKHSSKEESLVGQTHLFFLVSLDFFFQQVS